MGINQKRRSGSVVELAIVGVIVVGIAGLVAWRLWDRGDTPTATLTTTDSKTTTTTPAVALKKYTSPKHQISFSYPTTWSVSESTGVDETDYYQWGATIKDADGKVVADLSTGNQLGGTCAEDSAYAEVITTTDEALTIKGAEGVRYGYSIVKLESGSYGVAYGLKGSDPVVGTQKVQCADSWVDFRYTFQPADTALGASIFGGWAAGVNNDAKSFSTVDEAKAYESSETMKNVKTMVSSLTIGQ